MIDSRFGLAVRVARATARTGIELGRLEVERRVGGDENLAIDRRVVAWARQLLAILNVEVSATGEHIENGAAYPGRDGRGVGRMFIFNHRSALDIFLSLAFFEGRIVSRADLAGWPLVGLGARRVGALFVDRASARSGARVIVKMTRALEAGLGICIYPEGTAFAGDEVRRLHLGTFGAAKRARAEIVPVGICYADPRTVYGDEGFVDHLKRVLAMDRIGAAIEVGTAFSSEASPGELCERGQRELQLLVDRCRARLG